MGKPIPYTGRKPPCRGGIRRRGNGLPRQSEDWLAMTEKPHVGAGCATGTALEAIPDDQATVFSGLCGFERRRLLHLLAVLGQAKSKRGGEKMDFNQVPMGFGMALARNFNAMNVYSSMSEQKKREVLDKAQNAKTEKEMNQIINDILKYRMQ